MANYKQRLRRKPVAEINVVPYIDVMLVLLIIFMITAPLLTQGVKVDLPQAAANPVDPSEDNSEPLVASVDADGLFYLSVGDSQDQAIDAETLMTKAAAVLRRAPNTQIMVRGDTSASYGQVVTLMSYLQQAGAPSVGLITQSPEDK
jgi:biopolymer transport protein TolR